MGKRSRKRTGPRGPVARSGAATAAPPVAARPRVSSRRADKEEAPKPPWAPLPLGEIAILLGMIAIIAGFVAGGDHAGKYLVIGFTLVSIAGLELTIREHFAGFRSHSTMLSGALAILFDVPLFFLTHLPSELLLLFGAIVFAVAFQALRAIFARRTGGLGFRA